MGELSNINIFGRLLENSEMEAITLCQDYLEGDLVKQYSPLKSMQCLPTDLLDFRDVHSTGQRDQSPGRVELFAIVQTNQALATLVPSSAASFASHQCKIILTFGHGFVLKQFLSGMREDGW